jgi:hypothetical protein
MPRNLGEAGPRAARLGPLSHLGQMRNADCRSRRPDYDARRLHPLVTYLTKNGDQIVRTKGADSTNMAAKDVTALSSM